MATANLYTRDGGFVAAVPTPDFTPMPEIIQWGLRHFVRQGDTPEDRAWHYVEGLCWFITVDAIAQSRTP